MKNEIIKLEVQELSLLEESKAQKIKETFLPMSKMLSDFEDQYNVLIEESKSGITQEICAKAKRIRIDIGRVRIETGKLKDKQKEYIKLEDKAIMGVHNILVWAVKEKEDKLKEIENFFEIQEKKRLEKLQIERVEMISAYLEDATERDLSGMDEDVWNAYFNTKKQAYLDKIEAEKLAEKQRIEAEKAAREEQDRIKKENEKLRIEAEKAAKIEAERRAKEEAERKAREEKERIEKQKHEAEMRKLREESERLERIERQKREALEKQIKEKEEAERKAREEKERQTQLELAKGDQDKVADLINNLELLKKKYSFDSEKNKKMYENVGILIDKVITYVKQ